MDFQAGLFPGDLGSSRINTLLLEVLAQKIEGSAWKEVLGTRMDS